jgi:hypothetical protein
MVDRVAEEDAEKLVTVEERGRVSLWKREKRVRGKSRTPHR